MCEGCGFNTSVLEPGSSPYDFCPKGGTFHLWHTKSYVFLGEQNSLNMQFGEPADFNPSGFENCSELHKHIRCSKICFKNKVFKKCFRRENIEKADVGQQLAVSFCDGRIYYDGTVIQEKRLVPYKLAVRFWVSG